MHLDMNFNHLASYLAETSTKKHQFHTFFWSTKLHRDVQPLPVEGNASALKASEMTLLRQLLAHDKLEKSWLTFPVKKSS
jgi:hypothetical protein